MKWVKLSYSCCRLSCCIRGCHVTTVTVLLLPWLSCCCRGCHVAVVVIMLLPWLSCCSCQAAVEWCMLSTSPLDWLCPREGPGNKSNIYTVYGYIYTVCTNISKYIEIYTYVYCIVVYIHVYVKYISAPFLHSSSTTFSPLICNSRNNETIIIN